MEDAIEEHLNMDPVDFVFVYDAAWGALQASNTGRITTSDVISELRYDVSEEAVNDGLSQLVEMNFLYAGKESGVWKGDVSPRNHVE